MVAPEADLISLDVLSYSLDVDSHTLRDCVQRGLLQPDLAPLCPAPLIAPAKMPAGLYLAA